MVELIISPAENVSKILERAVSSVSLDTVSKILPNSGDEVLLRAYNEDIRGFELRARTTTGTERKYRYFELNCECRRRSGAEVIKLVGMRSINISQHQPTGPHSAGAVRLIRIWSMQNYNLYLGNPCLQPCRRLYARSLPRLGPLELETG